MSRNNQERTMDTVALFAAADHGLCTVSFARDDGTVHSSVVNAGVLAHPLTGERVVGLVVRGSAYKLVRWRTHPEATVVFRAGWAWIGVEGTVDILGPDDLPAGFDPLGLPALLREVFVAAGGTHDDWETYDRVMAEERRTAVFVQPRRIRGNRTLR